MRQRLSWLAVAVVLAVGSIPVQASSVPRIQGRVAGIELCPQSLCGAAVFVGLFRGQVGANPFAIGSMAVAVNHDPLPDVEDEAAITGGLWQLQLLNGRRFVGAVTGGSLFNNGDNTYHVSVNMLLTSGGTGTLSFEGTLSHNVFPPTINGIISQ